MAAKLTGRRNGVVGPAGRRAAANLRRLRDDRKLSTAQLAKILGDVGQPILATGITKTETRTRRMDIDDLLALAVALDVSPNRLLLTGTADNSPIELTPQVNVTSMKAWMWATGREPLRASEDAALSAQREYRRAFTLENQPHEADYLTLDDAEIVRNREVIGKIIKVIGDAFKQGMTPGAVRRLVDIAFIDARATGKGE
jgi:transcriptional regulator with XRE-family HTH domain